MGKLEYVCQRKHILHLVWRLQPPSFRPASGPDTCWQKGRLWWSSCPRKEKEKQWRAEWFMWCCPDLVRSGWWEPKFWLSLLGHWCWFSGDSRSHSQARGLDPSFLGWVTCSPAPVFEASSHRGSPCGQYHLKRAQALLLSGQPLWGRKYCPCLA